jgi:hypothetical protein
MAGSTNSKIDLPVSTSPSSTPQPQIKHEPESPPLAAYTPIYSDVEDPIALPIEQPTPLPVRAQPLYASLILEDLPPGYFHFTSDRETGFLAREPLHPDLFHYQPIDLFPKPSFNVIQSIDNPLPLDRHRASILKMSPAAIKRALDVWRSNAAFAADGELREQENPFPGEDMNHGWTRARSVMKHFREIRSQMQAERGQNELEEDIQILQAFKAFSLGAQRGPIDLDPQEFGGMFDRVFAAKRSGWARAPGSWWAARKAVFERCHGESLLEQVNLSSIEIYEKVEKWARVPYHDGDNKKKRHPERCSIAPVAKRLKSKRKIEEVMSEEWRARRRAQEMRAGRWTDGTMRMDRMWEEFHWVLDVEDPLDKVWKSKTDKDKREGLVIDDEGVVIDKIREVCGSDIWASRA